MPSNPTDLPRRPVAARLTGPVRCSLRSTRPGRAGRVTALAASSVLILLTAAACATPSPRAESHRAPAAAGAPSAPAQSSDPLPDTLTVAGTSLTLNGSGVCKWGIFTLYRGALYVERPARDARTLIDERQITSVRLLFTRGLSQSQLERAWEGAFTANFSGEALAALRSRIDQLKDAMTSVERDDLMSFDLIPGEGTHLTIAGTQVLTIDGDDFQKAFITLYLGDHPPDRRLRRAMLAGGQSSDGA